MAKVNTKPNGVQSSSRSVRGQPVSASQLQSSPSSAWNPRMIPLIEEREEDEEESRLRAMKEIEAKQMRALEAATLQKKKEDLAAEVASSATVHSNANLPHAYDSTGNIILVQPVHTDRLPNSAPIVKYNLVEAPCKENNCVEPIKAGSFKPGGEANRSVDKKIMKTPEFTDSFHKNAMQQPTMLHAMNMSSGVQLSENGRSKTGNPGDTCKRQMSRKEYLASAQNFHNSVPHSVQSDPSTLSGTQKTEDADAQFRSCNPHIQRSRCKENDAFNQAISTAEDWGIMMQCHNAERRTEPVVPSVVHNSKIRYDAVGSRPTGRERMSAGRQGHQNAQRRQMLQPLPDLESSSAAEKPRAMHKHGEIRMQNRQLLHSLFKF